MKYFIKIVLFSLLISIFSCNKTNLNRRIESKSKNDFVKELSYEPVKIPAKLLYYYQDIDFNKNGKELYDDLAILTIKKHSNILEYRKRHKFLKKADMDLKDKNQIYLIYSGDKRNLSELNKSFNTEHTYPQSLLKGKKNSKGYGDLHHLRYCDERNNSSRGNRAFTYGKGSYGIVNHYWYPGDEWIGDIARMMLYMNLRYNEEFSKVSTHGVKLFLEWNIQDPVSDFENQRNNEIEQAQGNRNPFIDNPYLATKIWGGKFAENTWK